MQFSCLYCTLFSLFPPYFINHGVYGRKIKKLFLDDNSVSTSTIPKTTLQYEWSTDKQGNLRELEQKATVGALKIEAHYDAKKNVTISEKKVMENEGDINGKEIKEVLLGLVIIGIKTEKGIITINY